jgi:hypothetical protein
VEITYTNTRRDQIVQAQALLRDPLSSFAFYHYSWVLYWAAMAALGAYVSLFVGLVFIACIFIAMFLLYAVVALPFRGCGSGQHGRPVVGVRVSTSACVWTSKGFTRPLKELLRASLRGVPSAASPSSTAIFSSSLPVTFGLTFLAPESPRVMPRLKRSCRVCARAVLSNNRLTRRCSEPRPALMRDFRVYSSSQLAATRDPERGR